MPKRAVPNNGRRRAINTKLTEDTRRHLEAAAAVSGRTLSGEIEHRLMLSVQTDNLAPMIAAAVAEGIAADRERQRADLMTRATPIGFGNQHGFAALNPLDQY